MLQQDDLPGHSAALKHACDESERIRSNADRKKLDSLQHPRTTVPWEVVAGRQEAL